MKKPDREYPSSRYAWYMVIVLTFAYILSFVDRYILGLLIEPIKADLGLTDTQIGYLLGLAFAIFYSFAGIPLGYLADRTRRTFLVAAGVAVWSIATAASGLAKNFTHLFLARMTVGAGEATLSPCTMSMISDSFPREKRGKPIAFYTAALSVGAGVASLVSAGVLTWAKSVPEISLPWVGAVAPWQFTFIVVGLPGILLALLMLTLREPKRHRTQGETVNPRFGDMLKHVASKWNIYLSFVSFVCLMTIIAYSQGWYAAMFQRTWGWEPETYATVNAIVLLAVGPLTVNLAGWMNDRLYSQGKTDAPLTIMILGVLVMVPTAIIAPLMPSPIIAMAILGVNTAGIAMTSATGVTGLMNITPAEIRGQVVAIYYMMISMSGLLLGPGTVGYLSDHVFGNENLNYAAAAVPAIFGIPVILLIGYARRVYKAEVERQAVAEGEV
ncbi:MAG: MFS transporter [Xanthomonadales bacterium]|nr:MFS transporter [Xanthomonadales bacterium]